jgi:hypothetical protein
MKPTGEVRLAEFEELDLLTDFANVYVGIQTGDLPKYVCGFLEFLKKLDRWEHYLGTLRGVPASTETRRVSSMTVLTSILQSINGADYYPPTARASLATVGMMFI